MISSDYLCRHDTKSVGCVMVDDFCLSCYWLQTTSDYSQISDFCYWDVQVPGHVHSV